MDASPPIYTTSDKFNRIEIPEIASTITIVIMLIALVAIIGYILYSYLKKK